jgi:hypothetical protein
VALESILAFTIFKNVSSMNFSNAISTNCTTERVPELQNTTPSNSSNNESNKVIGEECGEPTLQE